MAWKKLPIISKDKENKPFTENQLVNLDNMAHFRKWVNETDSEESVGYSVGGRQYIIDMSIEDLENELIDTTE